MAGGSSSPELFTAIIGEKIFVENNEMKVHREFCLGIFVAKGDVGVGTIVGSAVFNIVCVIGICGLLVKTVGEECDRTEYEMRFTF